MSPKAIDPVAYNDFDPTPAVVEKFLKTDTNYRSATFIETYTGRAFWPLHPTPGAISIIDIAHALSQQCRYSGHVRWFYSVAQHCCLLASWLADRGGSALDCLQILMHDAAEGYLVDIARPVKQYMPQYRVWDHALNNVIREWMGWKDLPMLPMQDELDSRVIVDERAQLMSDSGNDWGHKLEPLGVVIEPWTPQEAEKQFLMQYTAYSKQVYGSYQYINAEWGLPCTINLASASSDMREVIDIAEADIRGGVGRMRLCDESGIALRDPKAGKFPRAKFKWVHGKFEVTERGE